MSTAATPFSSTTPRPKPSAVKAAKVACRHCGAPLLDERMLASGFCCAGCSYVYRLVHEHGLAGYYNLKDEVTAPADATVFQPRDFSWLGTAQAEAESAVRNTTTDVARVARTGVPELTLDVQGISCAGCVWLIERVFQQQPGARSIEANAQLGQLRIRWIPETFSATDFARKLQAFGYLLGPAGDTTTPTESRALLKRLGLCAAFAMNVMLFAFPAYFGMERTFEYARLFGLLAMAFGTLSFLVGGTYFVGKAVLSLRHGALHIDLPISIGILGAYLGSMYGWITGEEHFIYFDFVATFILLMLIGRWAQVAAVERNQRRLLSQQPKPQSVRLLNGSSLPPEQLVNGQGYFAASGQTIPVESRLESAEGTFSLASINGEAEPRTFRLGQRVPAGSVNLARSDAKFTALQTWGESLLAQLLKPTERAGIRHVFLDKIIRGYLIGIIAVAIASGAAWWFATGDALRTWSVVTAVLVVSCPCAIGLAFPLADEMATVALRRRGVFVRDNDVWSRLARVRNLVFDKTGTLTLETPVLLNPEGLAALPTAAQAALHALVRDNAHPVSQCLLENLLTRSTISSDSTALEADLLTAEITESVGAGVAMVAGGKRWTLGRPGWGIAQNEDRLEPTRTVPGKDHGSEFSCDGVVLAQFHFADTVRPDVRQEIEELSALGYSTYILSGDRSAKVAALAQELGLPPTHAIGELTPGQKAIWIEAHDLKDTLMLGDGANDSLAFDRALCRGTPVIHRGVLEQKADFYYLGRGIGGLRALFATNLVRRRTQSAILVFSIAYNALAVGLAVAGHMNPLVAAVLMPINSLLTLAIVTGGMRPAFAR